MYNPTSDILSNPHGFLQFMQDNRYPVVHQSNLFFRDIEFAIAKFIEARSSEKVKYNAPVEKLAIGICDGLVKAGALKALSGNSYLVNDEAFMLPRPEPPPAKPVPAAAPAA
jgi:hypothetical protein